MVMDRNVSLNYRSTPLKKKDKVKVEYTSPVTSNK